MDQRIERSEILKRLRAKIEKGQAIVGTGAGTGLSAKCEERGGTDMIICYNSGMFRMAGRSSCCGVLPLGDANSILLELADEILPIVKNTPVIAGVYAQDPYRRMKRFLQEIKDLGFSGVQNFPSVGGFDGRMGREFQEVGMGYDREVEMVKIARDLDLLTTPYAWTMEQAEKMMTACPDILVAHCGCTTGGTIGVDTAMTLDEAAKFCQEIHDYVKSVNPETIVICHGGPLEGPKDVEYVLKHTKGVVGFYGASSAERLPAEVAITNTVKEFAQIML